MISDKADTEVQEASWKSENFYQTRVLKRFFTEKQI